MINNPRYEFSSISEREDFRWPGGKKIAAYLAINIEWFSFGEGKGASLIRSVAPEAIVNYSWRDYGNRVGTDRLRRLCENLGIVPTLMVNSSSYEFCPEIIRCFDELEPEIVAHGETNSVSQDEMGIEDERSMVERCSRRIQLEHGRRPVGWLSPWIAETVATSDILAECGYKYTLNLCSDDQPFYLNTSSVPLLSIPYPQELNDIPTILGRGLEIYTFCSMIIDAYRQLSEFDDHASVMGIAVHPYIIGQPHRASVFRETLTELKKKSDIWWTTPSEISRYYTRE